MQHLRHFCSILLFCLGGMQPLFSQSMVQTQYGIKDGLPSNETYDLVQDVHGYIWVSTDRGIARFDGKTFKTFDITNGMRSVVAYRIAASPTGEIVFTCADNSVGRIKNDTVYYDIPTIPNASLSKLYSDSTGFYVAYRNKARYQYYDWNYKLIRDYTFPENKRYLVFKEQTAFDVGLVTRNGSPWLSCTDTSFSMNNLGKHRVPNTSVLKTTDNLLVASGNSIFQLDCHGTVNIFSLKSRTIGGLVKDSRNQIWIGLAHKGITGFNLSNFNDQIHLLDGYSVADILEDVDKNLWVATQKNGIIKLDYTSYNTLTKTEVNKSILDGKELYFQHNDSTISNLNLSTNKLSSIELEYPIMDFTISNGAIALSLQVDNSKIVKTHIIESYFFRNSKIDLFKSKPIGIRHNNLYQIKHEKEIEIQTFDSLHSDYTYFVKVMDDTVFCGRATGLYQFYKKDLWEYKRVLGTPIKCIYRFNQYYALGTKGFGLLITDLNFNVLKKITTKEGLSGNYVSSIANKGDTLFVGTSTGLNLLPHPLNKSGAIFTSTLSDGLLSENIIGVHVFNNELIVSSYGGIQKIDIDKFTGSSSNPFPRIISINENFVETDSTITLKPGTNRIKANINTIYYRKGSNYNTQYKLEGFHKEWKNTASKELEFSNLSPGSYTLLIRSKKLENIEYSIVSANFILPPTFVQTIWFKLIVSLLIIALIVILVQFQITQNTKKNNQILKEERLKYQALTAQLNPHFIFNGLGSLQNLILSNKSDMAVEYLSSFSALINRILQNTNSAFIRLSDEIQFIDKYTTVEQMRFEKPFDFQWKIAPNLNPGNILVPTMFLQPFIENSIIHGINPLKTAGVIEVRVEPGNSENILCVTITDNGIGYSNAKKKSTHRSRKSIAMSNIKERLTSMEKLFRKSFHQTISDKFDADGNICGTTIHLEIPYKNRIDL